MIERFQVQKLELPELLVLQAYKLFPVLSIERFSISQMPDVL